MMNVTPHSKSRTPFRPRPSRLLPSPGLVKWLALAAVIATTGLPVALNSSPASGADTVSTDTTDYEGLPLLPHPKSDGVKELLGAPARPIRPGESLKFTVQYGVIHAGYAYLEVPEIKDWGGHTVYSLVARAESNSFFSHIYKVRNRIESYWDKDGHFSRRYAENRHEGKYHSKQEITFDYVAREAKYDDGAMLAVPAEVQDALSSFYYTRTQPLPIGGSIVFDYHASKKTQPLEVRILGRERVKVPAGTFDCIAIEPMLKAGGIFKNKGRLVIWITDDDRRMPVLMKSKVLIGSISVVLTEMKPGV